MAPNRRTGFVVALAWLAAASTASAQDAPASAQAAAPVPSGLDVHGSFDVGYRFRSLNGSEDTYRQYFDLSEGPRVLALDLHGTAREGAGGFADTFAVTASGLGGDPYPTLQVSVSKAQLYKLRVNWRRSRFFDVDPQTPASIGLVSTESVTDRHSWTTARQIGNAAWSLEATNRLHFLFNYEHVSNDGALQTTRSLDYVGASAVWGAFARANAYQLFGPVNNSANRVTGGASYNRDRWTVNYRAGYQVFDESQAFEPLGAPERSINVADPVTAREPLSALGWSQSRHQTTPVSELSFVARPSSTVEWRGEYLFYRYRGPFSLDAAYQGTARTDNGGTAFSPYNLAVTARGEASAPSHVLEQGVTWRPLERWAFDADYRYSRSTTDSNARLASAIALYPALTAPATTTTEDVHTAWRHAIHSIDLTATWAPNAAWTIRPGVRVSQRSVEAREDGVVQSGASRDEWTTWPEISVGYRPIAQFSARGSYRTSYTDTPYTRMSPTRRAIGRIVARVEPLPALAIETSATQTDAELTEASFVSHLRSGSVTASYAVNDHLAITGGLDYQRFLATGTVTFLRGTPPITDVPMRDREITRVWQAGIDVRPATRLGIIASANFNRTTGFDTIAGEPPLYGPQSFRYATGSIYYDVPGAGRVSVDLQRTYLTQDLLPLNNFRANLLTLRFSRGF
jgi:hypothetical protein